ncbi:hypothetical protein KM043_007904 [Ampulex compressa]|nr:hypothetical protein KM043_007904 [Ampulex compressa]
MVKKVFTHIKSDWDSLQSEDEVEMMTKHAAEGYLYGKMYAGTFAFVMLTFIPLTLDIVAPLNVSRVRMLHLEHMYLINVDEHYHLIVLHLQSIIMAGGTAAAASDILYISMTFHICGMYSIIRYRLEHLFDDAGNLSSSRNIIVFRTKIMRAMDCHLQCIEHFEHLKSCYIVSYILQLFVIVVAIVSLLANIQDCWIKGKYILAIMYSLDLVAHYFLVFLFVVPCQRLVNYSSDVPFSTYSGLWYEAPVSTQKPLLLIMHQTQKPQSLYMTGISDINFALFGTMLRMSFSYFMVIASLQN